MSSLAWGIGIASRREDRGVLLVWMATTALHLLLVGVAVTFAHRIESPASRTITGILLPAEPTIESAAQPLPMASEAPPVKQAPTQLAKKSPEPLPKPVLKPLFSPKLAKPQPEKQPVLAVAASNEPTVTVSTSPAVSTVATTAAPSAPTAASSAAPETAAAPVAVPAPKPAPIAAVTPPRSDAAHLNNPTPVYPTVSRRSGEQGRVLLDVHILADGSVGEIKLKHSSGFERLDEAAIKAVQRWRYLPAKRGEQPIAWWYVQPIVFSLDSLVSTD